MKIFCRLKIGVTIICIMIMAGSTVETFATEGDTKLNVPQYVEQDGMFLIKPIGEPIYLHLESDDKDSIIYFSKTSDGIQSEETRYTEPVLFDNKVVDITAINRKAGYLDSEYSTATYIRPPIKAKIYKIECNKIKRGTKKIVGILAGVPNLYQKSLRVEVRVNVKYAKRGNKIYRKMVRVGEKDTRWTIQLKKKTQKKDIISFSAHSKDRIVRFEGKVSPLQPVSKITVYDTAPAWGRALSIKIR